MKTIAVAMAKGGVAKTTIAAALAVRATEDFGKVAIVDLNPDQANLTQWWHLRQDDDEPNPNPQLFTDFEEIAEDIPLLAGEGWDICILDTPPSYYDVIETAIMISDAVVVPVKTSIYDAGTLDTVVGMCRKYNKPFAIVLSDVDNSFKSINAEVFKSLKADGLPVLPIEGNDAIKISHLAAYMVAPNEGKTGPELNATAAHEINRLWDHMGRLARIVAPAKPAKRGRGRR